MSEKITINNEIRKDVQENFKGNSKVKDITNALKLYVNEIADRKEKNTLYTDKDFIKKGQQLLKEIREFFTGMKIEYAIASTYGETISNIIFVEDATNFKSAGKESFHFNVPANLENLIGKIEELETLRGQIGNLLLIRNRVLQVQNYWQTNSEQPYGQYHFETYYARKGKYKPEEGANGNGNNLRPLYEGDSKEEKIALIKKYREQKTRIQNEDFLKYNSQTVSKRYEFWQDVIKAPKGLETSDGKILWYVYSEKLQDIRKASINKGHWFEALLHAASSMNPNKTETNYWNNIVKSLQGQELTIKNLTQLFEAKPFKIKGNYFAYNMDEAVLQAVGSTPFFQGGDVNFLLYQKANDDNQLELKILSYQAKGTNASEQMNTVFSGILLLYDILSGSSTTLNSKIYTTVKSEYQIINEKNDRKKLEDALFEDFKIGLKKPEMQKAIEEIKKKVREHIQNQSNSGGNKQ